MEEYFSFLVSANPGQNVDIPAAAQQWRNAADIIDALAVSEAGIANQRTIADLPANLTDKAKAYIEDPPVAASYAFAPATTGVVALGDLIVYQRQVNLRYANELRARIGNWTLEDEDLLAFCLATDEIAPPIEGYQSSSDGFIFRSKSTDARFLGSTLLDAAQVDGSPPLGGRPKYALVLYVGYSPNTLNVLNIGGRLILNNGSHRAYALMASGITHVPALIQHLSREDDLVMIPPVRQNTQLYLANPRPPMLKDYFNDSLHAVVNAPPRSRRVGLRFGVEQVDEPG